MIIIICCHPLRTVVCIDQLAIMSPASTTVDNSQLFTHSIIHVRTVVTYVAVRVLFPNDT